MTDKAWGRVICRDHIAGTEENCPNCDPVESPTPGTVALTEATEQLPSEVCAEVVLEKVDGADRKIVVDEMRVAPAVSLPNPFEGVEMPTEGVDPTTCPTCGQALPEEMQNGRH